MNDTSPMQALLDVLSPSSGGQAGSQRTAIVQTVQPTDPRQPNTGRLLTAALGDLPLDTDDIIFLQHTSGDVRVDERLLVFPLDDGQKFCCIGRF